METNKKSTPFVNIGSSSLLVIFLILCLVTFATLSLSSAQSDYKFSQKLADRRTDYYAASNQAEEVLNSIDTVLAQTYEESPGTYFSEAQNRLSSLSFENSSAEDGAEPSALELNFSTEAPSIAYQVPIDEKQALSVILELTPADQISDGFYRIRQWKVVSTEEWDGDDTLQLIQ